MKNPCKICVVRIICRDICPDKEDYSQFCRDDLAYYDEHHTDKNKPKDFDKKYLIAHHRLEDNITENKKFEYQRSSTSISGGGSSSFSYSTLEKKRRRMYWHSYKVPEAEKRADDYLRQP